MCIPSCTWEIYLLFTGPVETPSVSAVADEEEARVVVDESEPVVEASEAVAELDAAPAVEAEVEPEPVTVEDEVIESEAIVHPTPEDGKSFWL